MMNILIGIFEAIAGLTTLARVLLGAGLPAILFGAVCYFAPQIVVSLKKFQSGSSPPASSVQQSGSNNVLQTGSNNVQNIFMGSHGSKPEYSGKIEAKTVFAPDGPKPMVRVGNSSALVQIDPPSEVGLYLFPVLTRDQFKVETIDGRLFVSAAVTDSEGKLFATIERNEWQVAPPPGTWDRNYNSDSLEVIDPKGRVVLQVRLIENVIQLQGVWKLADPALIEAGAEYIIVRSNPTNGRAELVFFPRDPKPDTGPWPTIDRLFVYPGNRHLGELR